MGRVMAKFYEWDSQELFDAWHDQIMASKGIPNENTFAYTTSREVSGKVIATVEDDDAVDLVETKLRPPRGDGFDAENEA